MTQMMLAKHDQVIKAFASDRADQSFGVTVLPWRSRRCRSVANAHRSEAARKCLSVDPVPITDEVLRRALPTGTFLLNHADGIASIDLFVVPTISFRLLYGLLILRHDRRRILWLGVTAHPTAEWIARQVIEACVEGRALG